MSPRSTVGSSFVVEASRRIAVGLLLGLALMQPAVAEAQEVVPIPLADDGTQVHVVTLEYQSAAQAAFLVLALLSEKGTVEVRPAGNTLVIRDTVAALARILPVVRGFDHPSRELEIAVSLVRGHRKSSVSGALEPVPSSVPAVLEARLRDHLLYSTYELVAESTVIGREGEAVTFDLAGGFRVRFKVGTVISEKRIRLHEFEVLRQKAGAGETRLLRSNLNLGLDRLTVLAMTSPGRNARALMVVVTCRLLPAVAVGGVD